MPDDKLASRAKAGRPAHEPTDEQREAVRVMAACGVRHDAIAAIVGVSDETLRKHYGHELAHGNAEVIRDVANALIARALGEGPDAVNAQKFFLERRGGPEWRQNQSVDLTFETSLAAMLERARRRAQGDDERTIN